MRTDLRYALFAAVIAHAAAQSIDVNTSGISELACAGTKTAELAKCFLDSYPTGAITTGPREEWSCADQECFCSAQSLQSLCFKSYCPDYTPATEIVSYVNDICSGSGTFLSEPTTTGTLTDASIAGPTSTTAGGVTSDRTTATATGTPTSTAAAGAGFMNEVPAGGLLALFLGVVAIL